MSRTSGESSLSFQRGLLRHFFRRGPSRPPLGLWESRAFQQTIFIRGPFPTAVKMPLTSSLAAGTSASSAPAVQVFRIRPVRKHIRQVSFVRQD
jgi:hypothetical protein